MAAVNAWDDDLLKEVPEAGWGDPVPASAWDTSAEAPLDAALADPNAGWEFVDEADGVKVFCKVVEGSPIVAMRGDAVIDSPMAAVFTALHHPDYKTHWVDRLEKIESLEHHYDEPVKREAHYVLIDMPWPLSNRDFVTESVFNVSTETRTLELLTRDKPHPARPAGEDSVRGYVHRSNIRLTAVTDASTRLIIDNCVDPGGFLPPAVVNLVQRTWPANTVAKIRKLLAEKALPV
eukprot:EG_transcript_27279